MSCEWCGSFAFDPDNSCEHCEGDKVKKESLYIGSAPYDEDCAQIGQDGYALQARKECEAYANQLRRIWPDGDFRVKGNAHDYGTYYAVECFFDPNNSHEVDIAYEAESTGPANWDEQALIELGLVMRLGFGYSKGIPRGAKAAWGARAIWSPGQLVDLLPDRQDMQGSDEDRQRLAAWLSTNVPRQKLNEIVNNNILHNGDKEYLLVKDYVSGLGEVELKANPQDSGGYLYLCAYVI